MEEKLGGLVNEIRKKQKMTLKTLAKKTGLSISFLSQLERGKSSATLNSLKKISLALDVSPGIFFEDQQDDLEPASDTMEMELMKTINMQFSYEDLSGKIDNPAFKPMLIKLKPGVNEGEPFSHTGQEFLYVLKGILTLKIEEETHTLQTHESLMFDSSKDHYWYNYTNEDVHFLCIAYDR